MTDEAEDEGGAFRSLGAKAMGLVAWLAWAGLSIEGGKGLAEWSGDDVFLILGYLGAIVGPIFVIMLVDLTPRLVPCLISVTRC